MWRTLIILSFSLALSNVTKATETLYPAVGNCSVSPGEFSIKSDSTIQITSTGAVVRCSVVSEYWHSNSAAGTALDNAPYLDISLQKANTSTSAMCYGIYQTDSDYQSTAGVYALSTTAVQLVRIIYPRNKRIEFACILTAGDVLFGYRYTQVPSLD